MALKKMHILNSKHATISQVTKAFQTLKLKFARVRSASCTRTGLLESTNCCKLFDLLVRPTEAPGFIDDFGSA